MPSSNTTPKRVIGIDPGTAIMGYAVIDVYSTQKMEVLEYGVVRTPSDKSDSERLVMLHDGLDEILNKYKPTIAGCEQLFFSKNVSTAITVAQARGVILLTLEQYYCTTVEITPNQVKQAITGYGSADKRQVQYMTQQLLKLKELPKQDDAADALAIAVTAALLA